MKLYGKTEPRLYTPPLRELTPETSLGFACVTFIREVLHIEPYPWQEFFLIHALEIIGDLESEWHYRFQAVIGLTARQNGKTTISTGLISFSLNVLGVELVFGTSLSLQKADEVWELVCSEQENNPQLKALFKDCKRGNSGKVLRLTIGSSYKSGAPTRRGGRGDSIDLGMVDEVRELKTWDLWDAILPATLARPHGLVFGLSNAGDPDSIVLRKLRNAALVAIGKAEVMDIGEDVQFSTDAIGLFEWSAPDGCALDDTEAILQANPSIGYGSVTVEKIKALIPMMDESKFRAEILCQFVEYVADPPFPQGLWEAGTDEKSEIAPESELWWGIDLSSDRELASISVCGLREDGTWHIELVERRSGTEWTIDWFRSRVAKYGGMKLAFQSRGAPVSGLAEMICTLGGVERCAIEGPELTAGFGRFYDAVVAADPQRGGTRVYHLPQPALDQAAKTASLKNLGAGAQVIDRIKSPDDTAPLVSCIMAYTAATQIKEDKEKKIYKSAYAGGAEFAMV